MHAGDINEAVAISQKSQYVKRNLLAPSSAPLPYFRYRIARPFLKAYNRFLKSRIDDAPWLTPASIAILDRLLNDEMNGLEYGSGRSTFFFSKRLQSLTSVEHDTEWYDQVKATLEELEYDNTRYYLIKPDRLESNTEIERRNDQSFDTENENYLSYYELINTFDEEGFDFIIVDGRARVECTRRCISKLKSGGILVVDNSERKRYEPVHELLKDWKLIHTTTGLTDTCIWIKP